MSVRKIAAHYLFMADGGFIKYPIITCTDGYITKIDGSGTLHEIAGLEFYSGVIFPLFNDLLSPNDPNLIIGHSSFESPIVSKIVIPENHSDLISQLSPANISKLAKVTSLATPFDGRYDALPLIERISDLVILEFFKDFQEAFKYYTSFDQIKSEIAIGAKADFILCSNLAVVNKGRISSSMFKVLR